MVSAKFHAIGEEKDWVKSRILEEIQIQGLDGNVLDAGSDTLAVVVEGESARITQFYKHLTQSLPEEVHFTELEVSKNKIQEFDNGITNENFQQMIELLKEIEKHTRNMNLKLDRILKSDIKIENENYDEDEEDSTSYGWQETKPSWDEPDEEETEEVESGFSSMFG